jgi:FixJ family two-component response regulator
VTRAPARARTPGLSMEKPIRLFLPKILGRTPRGSARRQPSPPARVRVVALVVSQQDRQVLDAQEAFETRSAESLENAGDLMKMFHAPVVLLDRNWPGIDWRAAIQRFASSPDRPCVILISGVADEYLWESVVQWGGYDILAKPLPMDAVERVIKLALAYREVALGPLARGA